MIDLHAKFHIPSASGSLITTKQTESNGRFSHMSHVCFFTLQEYNLYKSNILPGDLCTTMPGPKLRGASVAGI